MIKSIQYCIMAVNKSTRAWKAIAEIEVDLNLPHSNEMHPSWVYLSAWGNFPTAEVNEDDALDCRIYTILISNKDELEKMVNGLCLYWRPHKPTDNKAEWRLLKQEISINKWTVEAGNKKGKSKIYPYKDISDTTLSEIFKEPDNNNPFNV